MTHDPFAVTPNRVEDLPAEREVRRADFGTNEFGAIWVKHLGGVDRAARHVLNAFAPDRYGFLDSERLGPIESGRVIDITPTGLSDHTRAAAREEELSRRLALVTVLQNCEGSIPRDLHRALTLALDLESPVRKRRAASRRAQLRGHMQGQGATRTEAVNAAHRRVGGAGRATIWAEGRLSSYRARMDTAARRAPVEDYPHAADDWFAAGIEDRVALAIIEAAKGGGLSGPQRWDLLNLIEGFVRRRWDLSGPAVAALHHALDLVDVDGAPRPGISLGSIVHRGFFIAMARARAANPSISVDDLLSVLVEDGVMVDPTTAQRWIRSPLFTAAVARFAQG